MRPRRRRISILDLGPANHARATPWRGRCLALVALWVFATLLALVWAPSGRTQIMNAVDDVASLKGHLIARMLGGSSQPENIAWQFGSHNNSPRKIVECRARKEARLGNKVYCQTWVDWSRPNTALNTNDVANSFWVGYISSSKKSGFSIIPNYR